MSKGGTHIAKTLTKRQMLRLMITPSFENGLNGDRGIRTPWGAHEEFLRALPGNNANVDEVVAAANRFLILLENSPEATWCCAKVLGDIDTIIERKEEGRGKMGVASTQLTDTGSVGRLHYALLRMIERCLPRLTTALCGGIVNGVQPQQ